MARRKEVDPNSVERVPWDQFYGSFRWEQGEHVALIGPTGSGKSTLAQALLSRRKYVVIFGTKPKDSTLDAFRHKGYVRYQHWKRDDPRWRPRRILWPDARDLHALDRQKKVFYHAFRSIYTEGGWCVYIDELWFFIHQLGFAREIKTYLQQARSIKISLVVATQRPAFVPLEIYDQSTHLFFWRDNDERNLKRISGIAWLSADLITYIVSSLDKYEVLYINTKTGEMLRTKAPPPAKSPRKGKANAAA